MQGDCTRNSLLYKPTTFGSKTSGASCFVKGESAIVGLAESGVLEPGRTEAIYERRVSKSGRTESFAVSGSSVRSISLVLCLCHGPIWVCRKGEIDVAVELAFGMWLGKLSPSPILEFGVHESCRKHQIRPSRLISEKLPHANNPLTHHAAVPPTSTTAAARSALPRRPLSTPPSLSERKHGSSTGNAAGDGPNSADDGNPQD